MQEAAFALLEKVSRAVAKPGVERTQLGQASGGSEKHRAVERVAAVERRVEETVTEAVRAVVEALLEQRAGLGTLVRAHPRRIKAELWRQRHPSRSSGGTQRHPSEPAMDDPAARLVHGLAPEACVEIFDTFLRDGRKASAGLPDLVVLPGPSVRIPSLFPKRLPEELVVVEVKGPGDAVRDAQKVWFDRLLRCGVRVELWRVEAS